MLSSGWRIRTCRKVLLKRKRRMLKMYFNRLYMHMHDECAYLSIAMTNAELFLFLLPPTLNVTRRASYPAFRALSQTSALKRPACTINAVYDTLDCCVCAGSKCTYSYGTEERPIGGVHIQSRKRESRRKRAGKQRNNSAYV